MLFHKNQNKVVEYYRKKYLNSGIIIFGIIFLYLIITMIIYINKPRVSSYEVREGAILKDKSYTGVALRSETVVYADQEGFINYYAPNQSKVHVGTNVYAISPERLTDNIYMISDNIVLTQEERNNFTLQLQNFSERFNKNSFSDTYMFKAELTNTLHSISNHSKMDLLNEAIANGTYEGLNLCPSKDDGIVVYSVDGLEGITKETLTLNHLNRKDYHRTEFHNNTKIHAGDPVYRIITDEKWTLAAEITQDTYYHIRKKNAVKIKFEKDKQALWANVDFEQRDGHIIAYFHFDTSMIRYATERYLDFEIILKDFSGLKIPKSSVAQKDFYMVPKSFLTKGGNSYYQGVLRQRKLKSGETKTEFISPTIYYEMGENDSKICLLDADLFQEGDVLLQEKTNDVCKLNKKWTFHGVYQINKGYAIFKPIWILCQNEDYYVIQKDNKFSISNYDHIALDASNIKEDEIVFQKE